MQKFFCVIVRVQEAVYFGQVLSDLFVVVANVAAVIIVAAIIGLVLVAAVIAVVVLCYYTLITGWNKKGWDSNLWSRCVWFKFFNNQVNPE